MGLFILQRGSLPGPLPIYRHLPNGWHPNVSLLEERLRALDALALIGFVRQSGFETHSTQVVRAESHDLGGQIVERRHGWAPWLSFK